METQLTSPSVDLAETYREFLADLRRHGEKPVPFVLGLKAPSFAELVRRLEGYSQGIAINAGFVPHSTFWLVDGDRKLVGVSNLRHELTPSLMREGGHIGFGVRPSERGQGYATRLLALTLLEAKKRGIDRALLTCDRDNVASAKVIEKNGGLFDSELTSDDGRCTKRFWIDVSC